MSSVGIGAGGVVGLAIETTAGTYEAPTKFFPIRSEGLEWQQDTVFRRVIRGTADPIGAVDGDGHVEGNIDMEVLDDVLPYFLLASRGELTQTGSSPFTYEFVPTSQATPDETLSITVVRNGIVFGYAGVVVSSMTFSIDDGQLVMDMSMLGRTEAEQSLPSHTFEDAGPFGAGMYDIQIPEGTTVEDSDNFNLEINDNGEAQTRLRSERGAAFISYGDRDVTFSVDRDFTSRAQYDEFKDLTAQALKLVADNPDAGSVEFLLNSAIIDTHEVSLDGTGDLVRASVSYVGTDTPEGEGSYKITVESEEDLGLGD